MVAKKLFWDAPYLCELKTRVSGVEGEWITVEETIFFAFSGGQESDRGSIGGYEVLKAEKRAMEIFYQIGEHDLKVGDTVLQCIDRHRRHKLMRGHFAAELVLELVETMFQSPEKIGAHIAEDKARLDFVWDGNIAEIFESINAKLQELIKADLVIKSDFEDAENEKRYWQIDGFAKVACGGTHIKRTGEIGTVLLKRNNIGKGKERIEVHLK